MEAVHTQCTWQDSMLTEQSHTTKSVAHTESTTRASSYTAFTLSYFAGPRRGQTVQQSTGHSNCQVSKTVW